MTIIVKFFLSVFVVLCFNPSAFAEGLTIMDSWARPVIIEGRPGAAYFIIKNDTGMDDKLLKATSPYAARIELHVHKHDGGVMKMMQVPSIPVAAHAITSVSPGGYHLMMFDLNKKLALGDELPLTLTFEQAGVINISAKILKKAPFQK
ncbi:MAG: copper chaperone PCu(A)C [Emcibacter sp.]|nr:copper chaperone PCu(A)C [Emcibacter sp.]